MASEEKNNGNLDEVDEQEPCMAKTSPQRLPPLLGRQTSVAVRARQYWQQLRRSLELEFCIVIGITYVKLRCALP